MDLLQGLDYIGRRDNETESDINNIFLLLIKVDDAQVAKKITSILKEWRLSNIEYGYPEYKIKPKWKIVHPKDMRKAYCQYYEGRQNIEK